MAKSDLTPKQLMFCREYIVDMNGQQAATRAGYSQKTARVQASVLLTNPNIMRKIQELMDKRSAKVGISADKILTRLDDIGGVDVGQAFDANGCLKNIHDIPVEVRKCIASIEVDELFDGYGRERKQIGVTKKIKFWDKIKANELLGKHKVLFSDRVVHEGKLTLEEMVSGSMGKDEDKK